MKTARVLFVMFFIFGFLTGGIAQIAGTAHDFSSESWAPTSNRGCGVCHTTHHSIPITSAP